VSKENEEFNGGTRAGGSESFEKPRTNKNGRQLRDRVGTSIEIMEKL
jgi:hypothetical protein